MSRLLLAFFLLSAQLASAQSEPPLIPIRRFVANTDVAGDYRVSQDGKKLLWSEVVGFDQGLAVREVDGAEPRRFATGRLARAGVAALYQVWLADNRHIVSTLDRSARTCTSPPTAAMRAYSISSKRRSRPAP